MLEAVASSAAFRLPSMGKILEEGLQASAPATFEKILSDIRHYAIPKWRGEGFEGLLDALQRRLSPSGSSTAGPLPAHLCKGFVPGSSSQFAVRAERNQSRIYPRVR